jgi:hypothetical protein
VKVSDLATSAVTGDKVAQIVWASLSTRDIIQMMMAEAEEGR